MKKQLLFSLRRVSRHKLTTGINILGLTLGILSCLVIYLYVSFEFSYDKFHTDADRKCSAECSGLCNVKLSASKQAKISRKSANRMDMMGLSMLNYKPSFQIRYAFSKISVPINDILLRFQERTKLQIKVEKDDWFVFFSYNTLHNPTRTEYLPYMETEEDVQKCVAMMTSFIEDPAMPL